MSLRPRSITISTSLKFSRLGELSESSGSFYSVDFEIEGELTNSELKKEILRKKRELDLLALDSEAIRGLLKSDLYKGMREDLKDRFRRALKDDA